MGQDKIENILQLPQVGDGSEGKDSRSVRSLLYDPLLNSVLSLIPDKLNQGRPIGSRGQKIKRKLAPRITR